MSQKYGTANGDMKGSTVVLTPAEADGTAMNMGTTYASPFIPDIRMSVGGDIKEFKNVNGEFSAFEVAGEFVDITFTLMPRGASNAAALLSSHAFRKGTPFTVSGAPVVKLYGHTAEGSPVIADLLNGDMFLQSFDETLSIENETSGTVTLRRYIVAISKAILS